MTEQQLNSVGSDAASDAETPNWSPIASLPRLPSYSKAFNIEGNLVAVLCFTAEENSEETNNFSLCVSSGRLVQLVGSCNPRNVCIGNIYPP